MSDEPHVDVENAFKQLRALANRINNPHGRQNLLDIVELLDTQLQRCATQARQATIKWVDTKRELERIKRECIRENFELQQTLAPALGYEPYPPGSPGYSPSRTYYITGDHTGFTLAMEAASTLSELRGRLEQLDKDFPELNIMQADQQSASGETPQPEGQADQTT